MMLIKHEVSIYVNCDDSFHIFNEAQHSDRLSNLLKHTTLFSEYFVH